jgi:Aspartate carbamoyltransferase, catalytic chain
MRHSIEGAQLYATEVSRVPIINAGDGSHSHPTQTLTDLLTIQRELGRIDGITIGFCGDLRFGRTVHSLIKALSRYKDIKVILIAPPELKLPDYIKRDVCERTGIPYREVETMEEVMPELDVLYMTRRAEGTFLDEDEFDRVKDSFVLDAARMSLAKKKMAVLHPLPRVNEILTEVDATPVPPISARWRTASSSVRRSSSNSTNGRTIRSTECPLRRIPSMTIRSAA